MSSNIRVEKTCEYCKTVFIAKTLKTRYCSHSCNSKAYKEYERNKKISAVTNTTHPTNPTSYKKLLSTASDYKTLSQKELLTIADACQLLNITSVTIRRWIKEGILKTHRIGKKHIITRSEIDKTLFK